MYIFSLNFNCVDVKKLSTKITESALKISFQVLLADF